MVRGSSGIGRGIGEGGSTRGGRGKGFEYLQGGQGCVYLACPGQVHSKYLTVDEHGQTGASRLPARAAAKFNA